MFATRDLFKLAVACSAALFLVPPTIYANPLTTMDQVGAAVMSCWKPPAGVEKSSVTLSFSLKSDGSLVGPPRATSINVTGDETIRKQFVAAAMDAVVRCTPVQLSPALGRGIGGQPFTMEFGSSDRPQRLLPSN